MKQPTIAGELSAQALQVQGSEWRSIKFQIQASPSEFSIQNGSLINAHQGQAMFSASAALRNWSYEPANGIKASLHVQQLRVSGLLQQLAGQHYPISGDLSSEDVAGRFAIQSCRLRRRASLTPARMTRRFRILLCNSRPRTNPSPQL